MKYIQNFLPLFHPQCGLKVMLADGRIGTYEGISSSMMAKVFIEGFIEVYVNELKPLLRPLSDMKDSDHMGTSIAYTNAFGSVADDKSEWVKEWHGEAARISYLRLKHFDVDGLIEAGLAIDQTKLPTPTA